MIPVMQTIFSDKEKDIKGDCLRACVASLMELPIEEVPHFLYPLEGDWFGRLWNYIKSQGYKYNGDYDAPKDQEFYIATGMGPRGFRHAVIYSKNKLIHDPHPDGDGIIPDHYMWFIKE